MSVLSTCVTKQTGDLVYSEVAWRQFLSFAVRDGVTRADSARRRLFSVRSRPPTRCGSRSIGELHPPPRSLPASVPDARAT
jgi:hypothetical protein